ncbi:MAG: hypothetical protein ACI8ZM_001123 [Crocinitomix sp.]
MANNLRIKTSIKISSFLPTIGIIIFVGLYFYAASLYPGGSQADLNSVRFDWMHNYWCNLMNETAMNGLENPSRPIAIAAMFVLCSSILLFFFQCATQLVTNKTWRLIIRAFGTLSMVSASLIFTQFHDIMTILSSVIGILVVIGIIWAVYKSNLTFFKISGIVCILLMLLNNYIYYSLNGIEFLPFIQKITFAAVLIWIVGLSLKLRMINQIK